MVRRLVPPGVGNGVDLAARADIVGPTTAWVFTREPPRGYRWTPRA
jgi:hypothetical protein